MEVHFKPELEAKVTEAAAREGRDPDQFLQEVIERYFDEEARLAEAVKCGEVALDRGEYLTHEEVGHRLARFLRF
jgi:predicted transcriptional regulator